MNPINSDAAAGSPPVILYIPGFGSDRNSRTFNAIQTELPFEAACLFYENLAPVQARKQLEDQIKDHQESGKPILLAGSSLGGYWTNEMAQHFRLPCILRNPGIQPAVALPQMLEVSDSVLEYRDARILPGKRTVFLGRMDDVIDPKPTEALYSGKAEIIWLEEGHRLEDMSPVIRKIRKMVASLFGMPAGA